MLAIKTEFLVRLEIKGGQPNELGATPYGRRRIVPVLGGKFSGPKLNGEIVAFGGDVALIRNDGVFVPDVDLVMRTNDGALIHIMYTGRWHGTDEAMGKLLRRDPGVDPDSYYFRTAVTFETSAPDYLWLNKLLAIGVGEPTPVEQGGGIAYNIHAVL